MLLRHGPNDHNIMKNKLKFSKWTQKSVKFEKITSNSREISIYLWEMPEKSVLLRT